jgi:multidrug efflux pump subunit AcrA (membrane-fusion protein)
MFRLEVRRVAIRRFAVWQACWALPLLAGGGTVEAQERTLQLPPRLSSSNSGGRPTEPATGSTLPNVSASQQLPGANPLGPRGSLASPGSGNGLAPVTFPQSERESHSSLQVLDQGRVRLGTCLVKVIEKIELPAIEAGVLMQLSVREGSLVAGGTVIATVDEGLAITELETAKRRLEASQLKISSDIAIRAAHAAKETAFKAYKREEKLTGRGISAESKAEQLELAAITAELQLEKAQHDFQVDQKAVKLDEYQVIRAQQVLERHQIIAPWSGVITKLLKRQSEWVNVGDSVLEMVQMERLWIEGAIDPRQLNPYQVSGRPVQVTLTLAGGEEAKFPGRIAYIDTEVIGQYKVRAEVLNRQFQDHWLLIPGMYVDMEIMLNEPAERISQQQ